MTKTNEIRKWRNAFYGLCSSYDPYWTGQPLHITDKILKEAAKRAKEREAKS